LFVSNTADRIKVKVSKFKVVYLKGLFI